MSKALVPRARIFHHVTTKDTTVGETLRDHFKLDAARIAELYALGAIYRNKLRVFEDAKLERGAYLRLHLDPRRFPADRVDWSASIVAEEKPFVVVNKPAGIPAHATVDNWVENALEQARRQTGKALLITQRLDTPVAGLIVFAKTPQFQKLFNRWLGERRVHKRYHALTKLAPPISRHLHYMEPGERAPRRVGKEARPNWAACELTIHSVSPGEAGFDVEIELHTGRTHQIRAQLSALGAPIVGDKLYGSKETYRSEPDLNDAIALCSVEVSWPRHEGGHWKFRRPAPWHNHCSPSA